MFFDLAGESEMTKALRYNLPRSFIGFIRNDNVGPKKIATPVPKVFSASVGLFILGHDLIARGRFDLSAARIDNSAITDFGTDIRSAWAPCAFVAPIISLDNGFASL
jgi:hypothetical protein